MSVFDIEKFSEVIGVQPKNPDLFQEAITHRSYLNEHRDYGLPHNERLEFLGDAVLELIVTEHLFHRFTKKPEGELTSLRAALVNGEMLAVIGRDLGVEQFLMMSRGETKDTGRARTFLIANAMEAIIGALYLDQGYDAAKAFIGKNVLSRVEEVLEQQLYSDPKSRFQELAQEKESVTPGYRILEETGPDHARSFVAGVFLGDVMVAKGEGASKQEAQRSAAENGLKEKGWQ